MANATPAICKQHNQGDSFRRRIAHLKGHPPDCSSFAVASQHFYAGEFHGA